MNKIYVIGMGPGNERYMTDEAKEALNNADVIIGYTLYINLLGDRYQDKELLSTPMKQEKEHQ